MPPKESVIAYLIDLMALIHASQETPHTFENLVMHLMQLIPCGYMRVDIIADTYRPTSIKDPEHLKRGSAEKVMVKSASSLLPCNFDDFLKHGDNKNRLLEIFKQVFVSRSNEIQQNLKCQELYYSLDGICYKFTDEGISLRHCLVIKKRRTQR